MILEALEWLTTPCPRWARSLGYLSEAIAIRHRARRCEDAWAPHRANSKAAILKHCPKSCREVVVLGAGLCLDVPVAELAVRAGRLTLVDAVRLRGVRLPPNARYLCRDAHGVAASLHDGRPLDVRTAPLAEFATADVVVSVNLLSQLPLRPIRTIRARGQETPGFEHGFATRVMRDHVADLQQHPGRAILIADAERRHPATGEAVDLRTMAKLSEPLETWTWPVAPPGEDPAGPLETTVGVWVL